MNKNMFFIGLLTLVLVGCATSTRYVNYSDQRYAPKDKYYAVNVYPISQPLGAATPYYVIWKVSVEGFASNGVSPETLANQAKQIARKKGADAIINANTEAFRYWGGDALLRFTGELIVYAPSAMAK